MATPAAAGTPAPAKEHWAWAMLGKVWERLTDATESDKIQWAQIQWEDFNFRRRLAGILIGLIFLVLWAVAFVGYSLWDSGAQELCRWPIVVGLMPLFVYLKLYDIAGAIILTLAHKVIEPFDPNRLNLVDFIKDRDAYQYHLKAYERPLLIFSFAMFIWPIWWMMGIAFLAGGITYYLDLATGAEERRRHGEMQGDHALADPTEKNSMSEWAVSTTLFKLKMWSFLRYSIALAGLGLIAYGDAMPRSECTPGGAKFDDAYASSANSGWTATWLINPPANIPQADLAFAEVENIGDGMMDNHWVSNELLVGSLLVPNATKGCWDAATGVNSQCVAALTVAPYTDAIVRAAVNQARCWETSVGMMVDDGCLRSFTGEKERLRTVLKARLGIALDPTCWFASGTRVKDRCVAAITRYQVQVDYRPMRWYQRILHPTSWGTDDAVDMSVRDLADLTSIAAVSTFYVNRGTVQIDTQRAADEFMRDAESGARGRVYGQCLQNVRLGSKETMAVWKMKAPDKTLSTKYWAEERKKNPSLQRLGTLIADVKTLDARVEAKERVLLTATSGESEYQVEGRKMMRYLGLPMWVLGIMAILLTFFLFGKLKTLVMWVGSGIVAGGVLAYGALSGKGGGKGGDHAPAAKPAKAHGGGGGHH